MAGLFLSHSSLDKPFVRRLAIDLVDHGMPVWFDTWELDAGDSLQGKIYAGLGDSDYVILVMSPNSVASKWVDKELTAALTLEEKHGRTVVLPIRLAECDVPLAVTDRIYADFSKSYLEPLEKLVAQLRKLGLDELDEPPTHALVPLVFEKSVYLDGVRLEKRVKSLRPRFPEGFEFERDQFIVGPDEKYAKLRRHIVNRKENIEDDPYYSPSFSRDFSQRYNSMLDLERQLIDGVRLIVNGWIALANPHFDVGIACHWFARAVRFETLGLMWSSQNPDSSDKTDFGSEYDSRPFGSAKGAARFLEVDEVFYADVGPTVSDTPGPFPLLANSVPVPLDAESAAARNVQDALKCSVRSIGGWELYSKYLIPFVVRRHLEDASFPYTLTFDGWAIGVN